MMYDQTSRASLRSRGSERNVKNPAPLAALRARNQHLAGPGAPRWSRCALLACGVGIGHAVSRAPRSSHLSQMSQPLSFQNARWSPAEASASARPRSRGGHHANSERCCGR
jgi:hypothetical protein